MSDVMTTLANHFLSWIVNLWNFCMSSWLLAFPITLGIMARLYDLAKRFLGK